MSARCNGTSYKPEADPYTPNVIYLNSYTPKKSDEAACKRGRNVGKKISGYFSDFCGNTSLHGFSYLGAQDRCVYERYCAMGIFRMALNKVVHFLEGTIF